MNKWFTVNFRTLNKYFPLTVIQPLLLTIASEHFSTKYSRPNHLFIPDSCSKMILFFYIPYTGQQGLQIRTQLHKLLSKAYPNISIRFVFRLTCRLSDFFPFKDRIPFAMRSHVVYKYKCQCCGALYVGQTRRHIQRRISEHMGVSSKIGKNLSLQSHNRLLF